MLEDLNEIIYMSLQVPPTRAYDEIEENEEEYQQPRRPVAQKPKVINRN